MKTNNIFISALAVVSASFIVNSCSNVIIPEQAKYEMPEGYSEILFSSEMDVDTKTTLNGLKIEWTGDENINIWFKDAGITKKVVATVVSHDGGNAVLSAIIPDTASKDHFIAEMNGSVDGSGKDPFDNEKGSRYRVSSSQTLTAGGFDPAASALGADWKETADDHTPHFTFKPLNNLLKITVTNNTERPISKITLKNDAPLANTNYWTYNKGYFSVGGSIDGDKFISLIGTIAPGQTADYCFSIATKNNSGMVSLSNMSIVFTLTDNLVRTFSNSQSLTMGYNSISNLGSFTINEADLKKDESTYAPFGTAWSKKCIKTWYDSDAFVANQWYHNAAADSPNEASLASIKASSKLNQYGNRTEGQFTFEFYAAEEGTGTLTFTSQAGSSSHTASIQVNGQTKYTLAYGDTNVQTQSYDLDVKKGDRVTIKYNNGSSAAKLVFYNNSADTKISWVKKSN